VSEHDETEAVPGEEAVDRDEIAAAVSRRAQGA
jgi:hypothetical protein